MSAQGAELVAPYYEGQGVVLYHGDCREILPRLTGDVLVTDPPFNVGKDYGASQDDLPADDYADLMGAIAGCGIERQAWVTPSNRLSLFVSLLGPDARMVIVRRGAKGPKRWGWFDQFDLLLVRGKPTRYESNLWDDVRLKGEGYYFRENTWDHPGYTPYPMIARLVGLLASPGETVIEPFAGTGTTLVAARAAGCRAIGIELEERWCEVAARRLDQGVLDFGEAS